MARPTQLATLLLALSDLTAAAQPAQPRPAFEVASIRPAGPGDSSDIVKMKMEAIQSARPPGSIPMDRSRVTLRRQTLASLIATAYRVRTDQVSGPSWMAETRFDIEAKIPEGAAPGTVNEMLQLLLEERFGLQLHSEGNEQAGYALAVGKNGPKLIPAAPAEPATAADVDPDALARKKSEMEKSVLAAGKAKAASGGGGWSSERWSRHGATMAQIVARLSQFIHKPVVDATALEGTYDVELLFERASDDTPDYAASQAVTALGLKLEPRKIPATRLVVDRVSKEPTAN